jgi:hypothetical protein
MSFIDRETAVARFQEFLSPSSPEWVLVYHGLNGFGKSTLLKYLLEHQTLGLPTAWIDFDIKTFRDDYDAVVDVLDAALRTCNLPDEAWAAYKRRSETIAQQVSRDRIVVSQTVTATTASVSNLSQTVIVDLDEGLARIELKAARERVKAWQDLVTLIHEPLLLFMDHWDTLLERGTLNYRLWITEDVLWATRRRCPQLRVILANEQPLREISLSEGVINFALMPLSAKHAHQLMAESGLSDSDIRDAIYERVGGNPLLLNLAITLWQQSQNYDLADLMQGLSIRAASEWLLRRILERMEDERSRVILERGVILQRWTLETLQQVCARNDLDLYWYENFSRYPFVQDDAMHPDNKTFIRTVREIQIEQLWRNMRLIFREAHASAFRWYIAHGD